MMFTLEQWHRIPFGPLFSCCRFFSRFGFVRCVLVWVAPDIFHLSISVFNFYFILFTVLSVALGIASIFTSTARSPFGPTLCPSDINAMGDASPLCDCLSRRLWILIVLRIIVSQVIERSRTQHRPKQLPIESGRNAARRESRECETVK